MLDANDADNVSIELYDSDAAGKSDQPGAAMKFSMPKFADSKVFIAIQTKLDIYRLLQ